MYTGAKGDEFTGLIHTEFGVLVRASNLVLFAAAQIHFLFELCPIPRTDRVISKHTGLTALGQIVWQAATNLRRPKNCSSPGR